MEKSVECVACRSELKAGATVCPVCKANQSSWRNTVTFLAGGVGLIALVASAVTYVASGALGLWKEYSWKDDVEVVYFASSERSLIANIGSGDVFVSQIEVYYGDSNISFHVNQNIDKGKLVSVDMKISREASPTLTFLAALPGQTISPTEYLSGVKSECVTSIFMSAGYPAMERVKEFYKPRNLIMSDATAVIIFVSGSRGSVMHKRFPVHWLLAKNNIPGC
jgi:hypothetical protein